MISLYAVDVSNYSAKVAIALEHKGLAYRRTAPPGGSYRSAEYRALVPPGTIPAIADNGFVLAESDAILEYLDEMYPNPPLLPKGAKARARTRFLSRFHDLHVEPQLRPLFAQVAPKTRDRAVVKRQIAALSARLDLLESMVKPAPLAMGRQLTMADCAWAPTLYFADRVLDTLGEKPHEYGPRIAGWAEALATVPAVRKIMAAYAAAVEDWLRGKLAA